MKKTLIFRQLFDYETWTYTYLLADPLTKEAAIIDSVKEQVPRDLKLIDELGLSLKYTLDTHVHADHITGAHDLRAKTGAKTAVSSAAEIECVDIHLKDGQELTLGSIKIRAISTPGHTNGCMSFYCEGMVFTGDTLFIRDVGRTDFQQGSNEKMFESITQKIYSLPDETLVYPGHDYNGRLNSTVAEEKRLNPKVSQNISFEKFKMEMDAMKLGPPKKLHISLPANLNCGKTNS